MSSQQQGIKKKKYFFFLLCFWLRKKNNFFFCKINFDKLWTTIILYIHTIKSLYITDTSESRCISVDIHLTVSDIHLVFRYTPCRWDARINVHGPQSNTAYSFYGIFRNKLAKYSHHTLMRASRGVGVYRKTPVHITHGAVYIHWYTTLSDVYASNIYIYI